MFNNDCCNCVFDLLETVSLDVPAYPVFLLLVIS